VRATRGAEGFVSKPRGFQDSLFAADQVILEELQARETRDYRHMYAREDEPQAWEDLIGCIDRVRARKTRKASREPLADGLQYGCCIARFGCHALPHVLPAN
jgi:hypothetical protein